MKMTHSTHFCTSRNGSSARLVTIPVFVALLCLQETTLTFSFFCNSKKYHRSLLASSHVANVQNRPFPSENERKNIGLRYPWPSDPSIEIKPYYVYRPRFPIKHEEWEQLCPSNVASNFFLPLPINGRRRQVSSLDVNRIWAVDDDPQNIAKDIIQECFDSIDADASTNNHSLGAVDDLASSLSEALTAYREFCLQHLLISPDKNCCDDENDNIVENRRRKLKLKCRLVASRGPSGAKCPQYHIDHVPVRWIQTFVGPGVELIDGKNGVRWEAFRDSEREQDEVNPDSDAISWTPQERNKMLVDSKQANTYHAMQGEGILMLGEQWNEYATRQSPFLTPTVHKSPEVSNLQPRVLLTQDVVFD